MLIVVGVVALVRASGHGGRSAEELLAERFARGQIDEREYRHRVDVLRGDHAQTLTK